jgi:hypothetical protein
VDSFRIERKRLGRDNQIIECEGSEVDEDEVAEYHSEEVDDDFKKTYENIFKKIKT